MLSVASGGAAVLSHELLPRWDQQCKVHAVYVWNSRQQLFQQLYRHASWQVDCVCVRVIKHQVYSLVLDAYVERLTWVRRAGKCMHAYS